jgi:hypothetical protein
MTQSGAQEWCGGRRGRLADDRGRNSSDRKKIAIAKLGKAILLITLARFVFFTCPMTARYVFPCEWWRASEKQPKNLRSRCGKLGKFPARAEKVRAAGGRVVQTANLLNHPLAEPKWRTLHSAGQLAARCKRKFRTVASATPPDGRRPRFLERRRPFLWAPATPGHSLCGRSS